MKQEGQSRDVFKPKECTQSSSNQQDYVYKIKYYKAQTLSQMISYMVIRPPRFIYNQQLLLPSHRFQDKFAYEQVHIPFPLSIYLPIKQQMKYIILYLHGNTSSRFQGYTHLIHLPEGVGLACFDFNGCGHRKEADFITLGQNQSRQVDAAAKYLKNKGYKVVGWGRSMGSVSLLMSEQCDVMIADSPFSSLGQICKEIGKKIVPSILCGLFYCFYPCVQCWLKSQVHKLSGLNINQLNVAERVQRIPSHKSIMLIAGAEDSMVDPKHSQIIFDAFNGSKKKILIFEGTHNSNRPKPILKQCFEFIHEQLNIKIDLQNYQKKINIKQIRGLKRKINQIKTQELQQNQSIQLKQQNIQISKLEENYHFQNQQLAGSSHMFVINRHNSYSVAQFHDTNSENKFFINKTTNNEKVNEENILKSEDNKLSQQISSFNVNIGQLSEGSPNEL